MTDSMIPPPPPKAEEPGALEDLIDIFTSPARVFERRAKSGGAAIFFIVALASGALFFTARPVVEPIFERQGQQRMASNPRMKSLTPEQIAQGQEFSRKFVYPVIFTLSPAFAIFFLGVGLWILAKVFGAALTFGSSIVFAALVSAPKMISYVVMDVLALTTSDPGKFQNLAQLTVSPGFFMDPAATNGVVLTGMARLDLFLIWSTILIGVGFVAGGKVSKGKAAAAAVVAWCLGTAIAIWGARGAA